MKRVQAYNVHPAPDESEAPQGFTVDKLLSGQYDSDLGRFAAELRQFGKPLFFIAGREPNGVGADYFGGFGPAGDKSLQWAIENKRGFSEFDPSRMPYASRLYGNIGTPQVCDGVERLKAAQRYYYDFFVRREGLKFLTFDTMGWAVRQANQNEYDLNDFPSTIDKTYARQLLQSCHSFVNVYPGDEYADWVSLTFYMLDYYAKDLPGLTRDYVIAVDEHMRNLGKVMGEVQLVAPKKPVFLMEFGFPDGLRKDSRWAAQKITQGLPRILSSYPKSKGLRCGLPTTITLKPGALTLGDLPRWRDSHDRFELDTAWTEIRAGAATVEAIVAKGAPAYGINTGFGKLANTHIPNDQLEELQKNIVLSHSAGVGKPLADRVVRLILILKIASLARGRSGVRPVILESLLRLLNAGVYPLIPEKGSVGACGDLAPLAHMTSILLGLGEAHVGGKRMPAQDALRAAGLSPLTLAAKEGLALLNGTQVSTALAIDGWIDIERCFAAAVVAGAKSVDAAMGSDTPFDDRIHQLRGQPRHMIINDCLLWNQNSSCGKFWAGGNPQPRP